MVFGVEVKIAPSFWNLSEYQSPSSIVPPGFGIVAFQRARMRPEASRTRRCRFCGSLPFRNFIIDIEAVDRWFRAEFSTTEVADQVNEFIDVDYVTNVVNRYELCRKDGGA
jgi:hypothetical protein